MEMSSEYIADLHKFLTSYDGNFAALKDRAVDHVNYIPYKKLYRYRKFNEKEIKTLRNNAIWLSSPSCFPDIFDATIPMQDACYIDFWYCLYFTFELSYIALKSCIEPSKKLPDKEQFLDEILKTMATYSSPEIAQRARNILGDDLYASIHKHNATEDLIMPRIETASSFLNDLSTSPRHTLAIASFSSKKDNRNMWENYAENYKGFCIEYDFSKMRDSRTEKNAWDVLHIFPVKYYAKRPVFDPRDFLRRMVQADLRLTEMSFGDDFLQQYYRSVTAKGYDYRAEKEWRLLMQGAYAGEYQFPYINSLIIGKDMSEKNKLTMRNISNELSVPILKQTISADNSTFIYVPC